MVLKDKVEIQTYVLVIMLAVVLITSFYAFNLYSQVENIDYCVVKNDTVSDNITESIIDYDVPETEIIEPVLDNLTEEIINLS